MDRYELGLKGEDVAAKFLRAKKWRLLARRYRAGKAELDLVALDGDEVVFVEVKTRATSAYGFGEEAVTRAKARELVVGAQRFLAAQGWEARPWRIDVIVLELGADAWTLRHIVSAVAAAD
jgi:putative endonuclease